MSTTNFKIKHDKSKHSIQINTLDETHKKIMNSFQNRRHLLPKKRKRLETLNMQLQKLESIDASKYTMLDIKRRSELKTDIEALHDEIHDIENDLSELDYYFKTEDIIMDYYQITDIDDLSLYNDNPELCEQRSDIDATNVNDDSNVDRLDQLNLLNKNKKKVKKVTKRRKKRTIQVHQISIIDFFNGTGTQINHFEQECVETETETETEFDENECDIDESDKMMNDHQDHHTSYSFGRSPKGDEPIEEISIKNKAELLDHYMMLIDSEYMCDKKMSGVKIRKCPNCNIEKTLMHSEGMYTCQKCGEAEIVIVDSEKPNYKEAVTDTKPGYPYKRINSYPYLCILIVF